MLKKRLVICLTFLDGVLFRTKKFVVRLFARRSSDDLWHSRRPDKHHHLCLSFLRHWQISSEAWYERRLGCSTNNDVRRHAGACYISSFSRRYYIMDCTKRWKLWFSETMQRDAIYASKSGKPI